MASKGRSLAIALSVLIAFWLIWSRLRIFVWVQATFWQILLVFVLLAVAMFVGIDYLFNRTR